MERKSLKFWTYVYNDGLPKQMTTSHSQMSKCQVQLEAHCNAFRQEFHVFINLSSKMFIQNYFPTRNITSKLYIVGNGQRAKNL